MADTKYIVDGEELDGNYGFSAIEWVDDRFFTIDYMGEKYHGD